MKSKKIFNKIAVIILSVLALVGIFFSKSKIVKNFSNTKDINARTGNYTAVQYGDERVDNTNFVTFDSYFLKSGQKYRGEYLPYTKLGELDYTATSKDLWVELRVLGNGSLKNAKLLFTQDNVIERFSLPESATIANDVIGVNANQVNLKEINNGTTVLFRVNVNADLKKFKSDENKVKLVGDHVANDGTITHIEKEVKFTVETSVDNAVVNNYYDTYYNRSNYYENRYNEVTLPTKDDQIVIEHPFVVNFGTYRCRTYDNKTYFAKLTLNEGVIESDLEPLNGVYPSKVEIYSYGFSESDYSLEYDSNTGKMKIRFNNVSKIGSNDFNLKIKTYYPKSAMNYNDEHVFKIKTKAYSIVNNNPDFQNPIISNSVEAQSSVYYKHTPPVVPIPRTNRFDSSIYPPKKDLPINIYEGDNPENALEDWSVAWGFRVDNNDGNQDVTVSSTDGNDILISSDSNNLDIGNFVKTKAIRFNYFDNNKLKDNSQVELYNKETGALIHTFNKEEIIKYIKEDYKIDSNVKKLKFVLKNIDLYYDSQYYSPFSIISLKTVDDKMIKDSRTREAFNKLYAIQSNYQISTNNVNTTVFGSAPYIESNRSLVTYYNTYFNDNYYYKTTDNRSVAKTGAIRVYKGNEPTDDLYTTTWVINSGNRRESNFQIISNNGERFAENNSLVNKSYSKFHGMRFPVSPKTMLGDDGWIKVYNNDTNELIAAFNSSNWGSYIDKPFVYENDVANIRVLTSKLVNPTMFKIENVMNISDKEVVDEINKDKFGKLNYINKHIDYSSKLTANSSEFTGNGNADISVNYYELNPIVYHSGSLLLSTYKSRSESFTINLGTIAPNDAIDPKSWRDSIVLMEFPEDIVDLKDVRLTGNNVNVSGYEVIDKDGKKFLKAYLSAEELKSQQSITFSAIITVNPVADNKVTSTKVYVYNKENDKYLYESNNSYERYVSRDDVKDVYDINGDGNKEEKIGYVEVPTSIVAPQELHINQKIINYNTDGDVVNAPNIGVIDGNGTGKATVVVQLKNNFPPSVTNVKILGAIPFKNNKGLLSGANLDSKNNTFMTGPIKIPDNLKSKVKVYYSENEDINRSWTLNDNQWKTEDQITDWSKVKNYYVDYGDKVFNVNELTEFSYEVNVPKNVTYNQPTFASNAVNVDLNTQDGMLNTAAEANKVGVQLLKRFNLEVDVKKKATDKKLQGLIYSAKLDGEENSRTGITNNDGIATINGLLVDKEYTLEKISTEDNYISENSKLKFKVVENNGNMVLQFIDGQNKVISSEIIQPTENTSTKVKMNFEYISKYNITLNKVDVATNDPLKSVQYELYEGEQLSRIYRTDKNGNAIFKKLVPGVEYKLKETYADGYYLNEPVKFKVVNTDGNPTISILSGNGENLVINKTNEDLDEASVKFTDIKAKRYSIDITKYVKGKDEKLSGAGFMVSGSDLLNDKVSETDSNGHTIMSGLYEYKPGQSYNGEYTIEEIAPPEGYTRNSGKLKIKAQRNTSGVLEVSVIEDTLTRNINTGKDIVLEAADTDNAVYKIGVEDVPLFTIIKTDAKTGKLLPRTKFAIYEVDDMGAESTAYDSKGNIVGNEEEINGVRYRVVETDENGEYTKGLRPGQYKFVELSTVDNRYEISKTPIYVGVGEKLKPKYGWTKTEEKMPERLPEYGIEFVETNQYVGNYIKYRYTYNPKDIVRNPAILTREEIWRSKEYSLQRPTVNDKVVFDDNVVLVKTRDNTTEKLVYLDQNDGHEIKSVIIDRDVMKLRSTKLILDTLKNKYIVYDDNYNKFLEFDRDSNEYAGNEWSNKFRQLVLIRKIGDNYYINIQYMDGDFIPHSYIYKLDQTGNVLKLYKDAYLLKNNLIGVIENKYYDYEQFGIYSVTKADISMYDLNDNKIAETTIVRGGKESFPIIDENGNIYYAINVLELNYYKWGIIVPETEPQSEIVVKNNWRKYAIKGKAAYGGSITDVRQYDYAGKKLEDVEIYSDSKKDIKITPDTGFKISKVLVNGEEIPLELNSDGSMDLPKFKNVTEDKVIEAQFSNTISYVRVNHYKKDTNEKIADSEILTGNYNSNYETSPAIVEGYELERNVAGEFVKPTNATGTFTTDDIEVNYYYQPKQVDVVTSYELENGTKIIPDSTQKVEYGKDYTTVPGVVDNKYELVSRPDNSNGKISSETPVTVRYIYKLKDAKVIVHHYIDGTTDKVPNNDGGVNEDQVINGKVDDAYNTAAITTIPANYKVVNTPANAAGTMTVDPIEVTYFYKLKDATIENSNFEKTSPQTVNNANQKFVYNIKYSGNVRDYIGKGVLEIVDTLPYKIDIDKSDLAGGEYDEEHKTIKWKILVNNINSFDNNGNVEIIKTFGVVYKDLPIEEHTNIRNTANVKFSLKDVPEVLGVTNKEKEVETTTDGQFARRITVNKTWSDDNNANGKRPTSIKYILK
nr:MucBP domain-containing protein [Clostridiales bacterium]